ncbi:MAG: hypothetical protein IJ359_02675 [Erysipelotrichaceae bacterium]|nr:hypothetical protein [Erysipelotrichaceae bacterium]
MKHIFYLQKGIAVEEFPVEYNDFYIVDNLDSSSLVNKYFFPGDEMEYTLDALCVNLYDVFQEKVFSSQDEYNKNIDIQPQWISRAGLDSDFPMSKECLINNFETLLHNKMNSLGIKDGKLLNQYEEINNKKYMYAYVADCQSLINTLQQLLIGTYFSFINFYKFLCNVDSLIIEDGVFCVTGADVQSTYSFLYSFIVQIYSIFDITTKIAYELENLRECEDKYTKMASKDILFGDKKKLNIEKKGTIFEKSRTISIFENLRNELIHNGTWEMFVKVFVEIEDGKVKQRYILIPDFTDEGTIVTFKNRKRFFSQDKKVNDELPLLFSNVLKRLEITLERLVYGSKN